MPHDERDLRAANALGLLALAATAALLVAHLLKPAPFDDAYMFVRYAKHALEGLGHAWNPDGVQTYGSTSLGYFALIFALTAALPLSDTGLVLAGSFGATLAGLGALLAVVRREARSEAFRAAPWAVAGALCAALMGQRLLAYHAVTGMDTMLAFATLAALAGSALAAGRGARGALAAAVGLAWLAFAVRPDSGLTALLMPALAILMQRTAEHRLREAATFVGGFGALLALDTGAKAWWFGHPLPLPYLAKRAGFYVDYAGFWNPWDHLHEALVAVLPFALTLVMLAGRAHLARVLPLLVPALLTWLYYFRVEQIMGFHARFYVPALALWALATALVVDDRLRTGDWPRWLGARALTAALLLLSTPLAIDAGRLYDRKRPAPLVLDDACFTTASGRRLPERGAELGLSVLPGVAAALPEGARFVLTEHGIVGAAAPQVFIDDIVALHDPEYALHGFSADRFFARQPDLIWGPHYAYKGIFREVIADPRFAADYVWWPDAVGHGLAVRRDSPHRAAIEAALAPMWAQVYPGLRPEDFVATAIHVDACPVLRPR